MKSLEIVVQRTEKVALMMPHLVIFDSHANIQSTWQNYSLYPVINLYRAMSHYLYYMVRTE